MSENGVLFEIRDRVGAITIDREHRRNALDDAAILGIQDCLRRCRTEDVGAIVLAGSGTKAFSAGSDLKELEAQNLSERLNHTDIGQELGDMIEHHPCPVIAAIEGYCLGGGLELALACDYRIAGRDASFGMPEVMLNALPSWGGTVRLPRVIGLGRAREVILFGRRLTADVGLDWGLVSRVVETGDATTEALRFAADYARDTDSGTVGVAKQLITFGYDASTRAGRHLEYLADRSQLASEAINAGVGTFVNKK